MAFPTIPTGSQILLNNQNDQSGTRTFPDLSSLTKSSGDLLIAVIVAYGSTGSAGAVFSSWGGGFTEFTDQMTGSGTFAIGAAYKWSTGSETGTFTVTQANVVGCASMALMAIPGAHASTIPEAGMIADGTTAAADPGDFNPAGWDAEDTLWISIVCDGMTATAGNWTATGTPAPVNYTGRVDSNNPDDNATIGLTEIAVAFRQLNAASENVPTSAGVDVGNARNSALLLAVRPAPETQTYQEAGSGVIL